MSLYMDLINDLGNELAVAFLIEKKYNQKLDSRAAVDLIERVKTALNNTSKIELENGPIDRTEHSSVAVSH